MAEEKKYSVWSGAFSGDLFSWSLVKEFDDRAEAESFFDAYWKKQLSFSKEETESVWGSPRLDLELKDGRRILKWIGVYYEPESFPAPKAH